MDNIKPPTWLLLGGTIIWEIVFVLDFLYDRDLSTWLHLVAVITWGVCTIISYFQLLETLESPKIGKS